MENDEGMYRELVENQQDLIVRFSPEGRFTFVNEAYCILTGKTKEQLKDSVFMPVTSEKYTEVLATQMTRLFRAPYACMVEQWIPSTQGLRCISWSAKSIRNDNGEVTAIVATGRDVTKLRQEQRTTRKRDDELMLVVESGPQMYYSHTPDHTLLYVSPRIRELLGWTPKAGKRIWTDYLSDNPINGKGLERTIRAISSGRREPPYRLEFVGSNDTRIWVEVNEIPVVKNGKTVAIAGSMIDISERKRVIEGEMEAEILIKEYGNDRQEAAKPKSPFSLFGSLFSREKPAEEEETSFEINETRR